MLNNIRMHAALALSLGLCSLVFAYFVTHGSYEFLEQEDFGIFFDYQAQSMLEGRFDVPDFAISGEAFVVDGKLYGYFGITPSILRMPFIFFDSAFGQMSRSFMVTYFVIALLCAFQIFRLSVKTAIGLNAEPPAWATIAFILMVGLGSTMMFLGSRSFIYHEAILCGIAFSMASSMFAMQWITQPSKHWWIGAVVCAALAVHARPSVGLFSLSFISSIAVWLWVKTWLGNRSSGGLQGLIMAIPRPSSTSLAVIFLCCIVLLSVNLVSYLKFGTVELSPLRYHVQVQASPERLANVAGGNFYLANLPINIDAYITGRHFTVEPHFPYMFASPLLHNDLWHRKESRIDNSEPTVAIPFSMSALFVISIVGGICALVSVPQLRSPFSLVWLSVLPMAFALFTAVATSHRYTGDFVPFLVVISAIGLAAIMKSVSGTRVLLAICITAAACISAFVSVALAIEYQDSIWGVEDSVKKRHLVFKRSVDEFFGE